MKRIILASQSPQRKELLEKMGLEFEVIKSNYDEHLDDSRDPEVVAKELGLGKAMDVAKDYPDAYVVGGDTIVTINGRQLEKPTSIDNARELLTDLSGQTNYVSSSVALVCLNEGVELLDAGTVAVTFKPYDAELIEEYLATGDMMNRAGAYGAQHPIGSRLVESIEGDYDTLLGLPTAKLAEMLRECGFELTTD